MFTGIVQAVGRVAERAVRGDGVRLRVHAGTLDLRDVAIGDSIAVAGCCLTVVEASPPFLAFDVSGETLRCTTAFPHGSAVNLEKALRFSDRLGGHLVSGHVDGVGEVLACSALGDADANRRVEIDAPAAIARYIARKGSIAVDGVSLTTNTVAGTRFTVNLIPHTLAVTTLAGMAAGARVNLEVDVVARYVERLRDAQLRDPANAASQQGARPMEE
jgi:riboflavin synthase